MKKWNLIADIAKCTNCRNCFLACKEEHIGNDFPGYSAPQPKEGHQWIQIHTKERGQFPRIDVAYLPYMCNQCDDAPCVKASTDGAVYQRDDGIVMIDPDKARGNKDIVSSCPYGNIWWNDDEQLPQKWNFDAHLIDQGWKEPRCVQVCAMGALQSIKVEDEEMKRVADSEGLEVLHPEYEAKPRIYYKNLHRFTKCIITGSVATKKSDIEDCVEGVRIQLSKDDEVIDYCVTDCFGEFKFDGLEPDSGVYQLDMEHDELGSTSVSVEMGGSQDMAVLYI